MVKFTTSYKGDLQTLSTHLPSKTALVTDAPVDIGGKGSTFSPTDLVAVALTSCIATTIADYANRKGWLIKAIDLEVEKIMTSQPKRRIGKLPVNLKIEGSFSQEQKEILEKVVHSCPVHHSLHPDIEVPIHIEWT